MKKQPFPVACLSWAIGVLIVILAGLAVLLIWVLFIALSVKAATTWGWLP